MLRKSPHDARPTRGRKTLARRAAPSRSLPDEFLSKFCHEVRTPLTAILLWTRALRAGHLPDAERSQAVEALERSAKSQADLVDDALEFLRMTAGKIEINLRETELAALVRDVIHAAQTGSGGKKFVLAADLDSGPIVVRADAARLRRVINKLLANAIRFSPGGGRIEVSLRRVGRTMRLKIADRGRGIDGQTLPYIFEVTDPRRPDAGLCLGLAIARRIVEMHGGTIGAHSPGMGRGSVFTLELPIAAAGTSATGPAAKNPFRTSKVLAGVRALLVESQADTRNMIQWMLEQSGADVTAVATPRQALASLDGNGHLPPNLLVAPLVIDRAQSQKLIQRIRAVGPDGTNGRKPPAIAIAEKAGKSLRLRALKAGYSDVISKPVDPDELLQAAARLSRAALTAS
ncbi:MAG: hybrid sensor histidine kinase/response regulator [Tepidisphaeraceae bacterium]